MSLNDTIEKPIPAPLPSIHQQIEGDCKVDPEAAIGNHTIKKIGLSDEQCQFKVSIDRELSTQNVSEVTESVTTDKVNQWESIFSPQTTFKQNEKGGLEYTGLDASRISLQTNATLNTHYSEYAATIPNIMPTPMLGCIPNDREGLSVQDGSRLDILRNVLGSPKDLSKKKEPDQNYSHPDIEKCDDKKQDKTVYWTQQRMFWTGFVCPLFWFYGSFQKKVSEPLWRKRCRFATFYFLVVVAVIVLLIVVRTTDGTRRTHSDGIKITAN
ncbi:hypothetical protein BY458DRAFT_516413 [Sporodiniella umbellata]|nr:hypothetical protein BY458DRAFT_516413 [Sporodiniella umbellata]